MTHTTEMVPASTTLAAPEAAAGNVTVDGSLVININGRDYTLSGTVGTHLIVKYASEFPDGANIGTILDIVGSVATALGAPGLKEDVESAITSLNDVPILGSVVKALTTSPVQITYLEINTATNTYGFGFAVDFRGQGIKVGEVELSAFGLKVSYIKPAG
ncbi:MAG: hypothetical protein AAFY88_07710 [Acidobacteriota bacterium]